MTLILAAQAFATLMMVGVIWMCQIAHYPLFADIGDGMPAYQARNRVRTTYVVAAPMLVEAITALIVLIRLPDGVPMWAAWAGIALVAVCWITTFLRSVPAHERLTVAYDPAALDELLRTNWIRTVAWTARGVLVLWMLVVALG